MSKKNYRNYYNGWFTTSKGELERTGTWARSTDEARRNFEHEAEEMARHGYKFTGVVQRVHNAD